MKMATKLVQRVARIFLGFNGINLDASMGSLSIEVVVAREKNIYQWVIDSMMKPKPTLYIYNYFKKLRRLHGLSCWKTW